LVEYNKIDQENAEPAERSSAYWWWMGDRTYEDWGDNDYFVKDPRGYKIVLSGMVKDLEASGQVTFKYDHPVDQVNYAPGNVGVTGTSNGQAFNLKADSIISSVSVGVLNNNDISFNPTFPTWKSKAVGQIEMGLEDKIFVAMPKSATWIPKHTYFAIASDTRDHNLEWLNWGETTNHKILMAFETWTKAKSLEKNTDTEIADQVESLFRSAFAKSAGVEGQEDNGMFRPVDVFMTKWWNNKYFRGSFSFLRTGAMAGIPWSDLTDPLTGTSSRSGFKTLYLTGEALSPDYAGYVSGALLAGETTAKQVMQI